MEWQNGLEWWNGMMENCMVLMGSRLIIMTTSEQRPPLHGDHI